MQEGDKNLQAIARRFDTAAMLILEANNTIAPVPKPETTITIPSRCYYLMHRVRVIVNLAELRLYYYPPGENIVQVLSIIGIGLQGPETPVMETRVGQKILTQPGRLRQAFVSVRWSVALNYRQSFLPDQITR